jgi:hypothetical protein
MIRHEAATGYSFPEEAPFRPRFTARAEEPSAALTVEEPVVWFVELFVVGCEVLFVVREFGGDLRDHLLLCGYQQEHPALTC